jgi:hypothetical protein
VIQGAGPVVVDLGPQPGDQVPVGVVQPAAGREAPPGQRPEVGLPAARPALLVTQREQRRVTLRTEPEPSAGRSLTPGGHAPAGSFGRSATVRVRVEFSQPYHPAGGQQVHSPDQRHLVTVEGAAMQGSDGRPAGPDPARPDVSGRRAAGRWDGVLPARSIVLALLLTVVVPATSAEASPVAEPVTSAFGRIAANPEARGLLVRPAYRNGRPVARLLSGRIDSEVVWRAAASSSVAGFEVTVNGIQRCAVPAAARSCRLLNVALQFGDVVEVVTVGADHTRSAPTAAPLFPTNRLLGVFYWTRGRFVFDDADRRVLDGVAEQARSSGLRNYRLAGHTDSDGSADLNRHASGQQATYLNIQIDREHPELTSTWSNRYGEARPVVPNTTRNMKAANRRVEIYAALGGP